MLDLPVLSKCFPSWMDWCTSLVGVGVDTDATGCCSMGVMAAIQGMTAPAWEVRAQSLVGCGAQGIRTLSRESHLGRRVGV
jgi:hypothetical protein